MFPSSLQSLDLSILPPTYILPTRLTIAQLTTLQSALRSSNVKLADTAHDASLFIADVQTAKRTELELRKKHIHVLPAHETPAIGTTARNVRVVKLKWLTETLEKNEVQKLDDYTVLAGFAVVSIPKRGTSATPTLRNGTPLSDVGGDNISSAKKREAILERAALDAEETPAPKKRQFGGTRRGHGTVEEQAAINDLIKISHRAPPLLRRTTSSFEAETTHPTPDLPDWVCTKNKYSCCRSTPAKSPNDDFIAQLKVIRHSRKLASDQIGVRAYSTAIAALKAYPYALSSMTEIQALPGCDGKIAALFQEYRESGSLEAVKELSTSTTFRTLREFESIWSVGADTARKFVYDLGFTSLHDIIHGHWDKLSRVQQIGIKYYDELLLPMPRGEQERVAAVVGRYAQRACPGVECMLVGGYRRGKQDSHDVDVLISHRVSGQLDENFLLSLLHLLEDRQYITHTLTVSTSHLKNPDAPHRGGGNFDGLDKALLVWQDRGKGLHRRVDIIVAPTVCAGTALLGWSGGNTFQRDLRLWCEKERGWKFASEGVWEGTGRVQGTEGWREGEEWVDVEKRVLERVGVGWRPPEERCTG